MTIGMCLECKYDKDDFLNPIFSCKKWDIVRDKYNMNKERQL